MENTSFLKLKKPSVSDFYNVGDFNDNADIIDTEFTKTLRKKFVTDLPSSAKEYDFENSATGFSAVERCSLGIISESGNNFLKITTAENSGNKYALSNLNFADIGETADTFVIEIDTKMPAGRWYISLVDISKRPGGSNKVLYDLTGVAFHCGTTDGSTYNVNGNKVFNEEFIDTWLRMKLSVNVTEKTVKYEIRNRETNTLLASSTEMFSDDRTSKITGIELYTYTETFIDIDNVKITANHSVDESVMYCVGGDGIYDTYVYFDGVPILISSQTNIQELKSISHQHSNKSTLDSIENNDISNWNAAYDDIVNAKINTKNIDNESVDNITAPGIYKISANTTGLPFSDRGILIVFYENPCLQICLSETPPHETTSAGWYHRRFLGSAWTDWETVTSNIRKNPASLDGDIIGTHFTVGHRTGTIGANSFCAGGAIDDPNAATGKETAVVGGVGNAANDFCTVVVGGAGNMASGSESAVVGGYENEASGTDSASIGGVNNLASGGNSITLGGFNNVALDNQIKAGHNSKNGTTEDAFIIGNGTTDTARSNAFRVAYSGSVYGAGSYNSSGADIAELYEWIDGNPNNEDRRGLFVTLDGTKIRIAESTDKYIKGVVSAAPALVGDSYSDNWHGMYLTDVFGIPLKQTVHHAAVYREVKKIDPETEEEITESVLVRDEYDTEEYILNPDYDSTQEYIPREQRKEWDYVSSWGKLVLLDDGTCEVNGFATVGEGGKATKADTLTIYRVMERKDDSHVYVAIG